MHKKLQKNLQLVPIWRKMGKNKEEIKALLLEQGLLPEETEKIIKLYSERLIKAKEKINADRIRYANELDKKKLGELIQMIKDWYLYRNPNKYQIRKKLNNIGVAEKYHEDIRIAARERAHRAANRKGNWKIVLGMIISIVGTITNMFGLDTTGEWWPITRLPGALFTLGVVLIAWGFAQKEI
jgi:hypothetical protein